MDPTNVMLQLLLACLVVGMALLVPDEGENRLLELAVNKTAQADLVLHLFSNNVTIAEASVLADFTEVTGGGYASKSLTGATWAVAASLASYVEQVFTFTSVPGVATVYGYYITHGTKVLWAENLPGAPFTILTAGDEVRVTPQFTQA